MRKILAFQIKSIEEIDDIVSKTFKKCEGKINFE